MFLSTYPVEKLLRLKDMSEVNYVLGLYSNIMIKPPRCPKCGEFVYLDEKLGMYQCSYCNDVGTLYFSHTLNLRKPWEVYYGTDNKN